MLLALASPGPYDQPTRDVAICEFEAALSSKIMRVGRNVTPEVWSASARLLYLTIVLVCIALTAPPCGAQEVPRTSPFHDLQSIVDAKVLRVALTRFDLPAFHIRGPDGALTGAEIDMAKQIGRALGVKVEFVDEADSFDAVVDLVAVGRADIGISKLSQTYRRLHHVRFSEPYVTLRHALLFNRSMIAQDADRRPPAAVLQEYNGRIGVIAHSAYVDFAKANFPAATVIEGRTWDDVIATLLAGKVEVIYRDEFEIRRVVKNNPALNVKFGTAAITDQVSLLSIAICDTCSKLQELINYHLEQTRNGWTLKALLATGQGK
jgi:polar amino acid transport system substrate-binding protein